MNLEDKIREALPQLNKLTKGCLIKESDSIKEVILRYKWDFIDTYSKERIIETFDIRKPTFEIIGHPVKLNDVIEYVGSIFYQAKREFMMGAFSTPSSHGNLSVIYFILLKWDLSSVFLTDQNEELKIFLNSL